MKTSAGMTADLRDQEWLDARISHIDYGIDAVIDIARNWTDGRNLGRLHPGVNPADYIGSHVQHALGRSVVLPLLEQSDWSNRQIAEVAGVGVDTVRRVSTDAFAPVERPARTLGADGKYRPGRVIGTITAEVIEEEPARLGVAAPFWPQLLAIRDAIRDLSAVNPDILAANVPAHRRRQFAKDLRRHGLVLGAVAARLEVTE